MEADRRLGKTPNSGDGCSVSGQLSHRETEGKLSMISKASWINALRQRAIWSLKCPEGSRISLVKTILLVEDSRFLRVMNERTLTRAGYRVVTACDGEEALRMAYKNVPDLILLDMLLPRLFGPEVLRSLRTTPQTSRVPIVVLSSLPQSNEPQLRKDGATAYLDKSTLGLHEHSEPLIQTVKRILDDQTEQNGDAESSSLGPAVLPQKSQV